MRPGVTLTMIVKNEERCLARCLRSVREGVDAIVIVDTGSTDGTPEIARQFGAKVECIPWPDAFDQARNASLELVETEWTLWMDADEWLVEGAARAVRKAITRENAFAYHLIRKDLLSDGRATAQAVLRLWRTSPKLRFVGIIHEHFTDEALESAFPGKKLFQTDIALLHDGFREEVAREKLLRNLGYLRRELEARPGQMYYEVELGNTLKRLGDPEGQRLLDRIADDISKLQHLDEPPERMLDLFLATYLGELRDEELFTARTDALLRLARGWFPRSPLTLSMAAQVEIRRGNLLGAYRDLLEVERMADTGDYDKANTVHPRVLQEGLYTNLGIVAQQLGKLDVAKRNYQRLLSLDPTNHVALQNMRFLL